MKLSTVESIIDSIAEKHAEVIGVYHHDIGLAGFGGIKICLGHFDKISGNLRVSSYSFGFRVMVETIHPNPNFNPLNPFIESEGKEAYFRHTYVGWGNGPFSAIHKKIKAIKKRVDAYDAMVEERKFISAINTMVDLTGVEFEKQILEDK